jgi:hypothetical protein
MPQRINIRPQCCVSGSAWIGFVLGSRIRITFKVKSRMVPIRIRVKSRIRIRLKAKIQDLRRLKREPWRAVDAHNGGSKWRLGGSVGHWSVDSHHFDEDKIRIPHQSDKSIQIRICIKVKKGISIQIRNTTLRRTFNLTEGLYPAMTRRDGTLYLNESLNRFPNPWRSTVVGGGGGRSGGFPLLVTSQ